MNKLANGKLIDRHLQNEESWAAIRFDKILKLDWVRKEFDPKKPVRFLPETIRNCECGRTDILFITIMRDNDYSHPMEIPLEMLCLSQQQKAEFILQNLVPKNYFRKKYYYIKNELFQPIECGEVEENDDDY